MKHKVINFDWFFNHLIVHNLLINYLNLKKWVNTEGAAHRRGCSEKEEFLKFSQYSEENICVGVSF